MSSRHYDTVSFLSDFGHGSDAVGIIKSILRDLAPDVVVIDIAHDIAPFDVRAASLALARAVPYLPEGIIITSVDPGAGGNRRIIAVEIAGGAGIVIGPDNGLIATGVALAGGADRAVVLDRDEHHLASPGATFAARDVMAPVAAALCAGADLFAVGTEIDAATLLPSVVPIPREENGGLACEVIWIDRFGNCQLNVSVDDLGAVWGTPPERVRVSWGDNVRNLRITTSYADLGAGALGLVVDSTGLLSLSLDRASAARELGVGEGEGVLISPSDEQGVTVPVTLRA
ncbi:MAG: SAM-dependent chlorinase/fluorinase [Actinobacteria bacterium]|nr:SAM-dependent chlorinase/fluorinase [Actinomycetota bacterium]